jgi:uncharacterized integral membrane protein
MNLKLFLRVVVFLAILFVMLYMGMHNSESIKFSFPILFEKPVDEPAAFVFFGIFAIGVLAGAMLGTGGSKGASRSSGSKDK